MVGLRRDRIRISGIGSKVSESTRPFMIRGGIPSTPTTLDVEGAARIQHSLWSCYSLKFQPLESYWSLDSSRGKNRDGIYPQYFTLRLDIAHLRGSIAFR